ncbi:MAG TPA: dephospho-CoA kinase [Candidatus Dormibacteraeota bacterium]|nr:dephospho-CoA kinase [Candidatus Dormibacteraeota bacterium]
MRLIGLTGGIATGKSTVAGLLAGRGAVVVDADLLAREVVAPGSPGLEEIARTFGTAMLTPEGELDRPALGALVFADPGARRRLEAITHPRIGALMAERIAEGMGSRAPLVVADIPLLFEGGRTGLVEGVLLVNAPDEVQLHRLMLRDGLDEAAARARVAAQMPMAEKRQLATWVIDNGGTPEATAAQVEDWWAREVG